MPPRAAEMNEPDTLVGIGAGAATGGAGGPAGAAGSKGLGSAGTWVGSTRAPNVQIPAAPATALAPRRSAARRESSGTSTYCRPEQRRTQSHAVPVGNMAVTVCQRPGCTWYKVRNM